MSDCERVPEGVIELHDETDGVADKHNVALLEGDTKELAERHSVALPDSDAIVADAEGVSRLGAQNGPILNVARCVPSIDSSGEGDASGDGEPVPDACTVATERVTVSVIDVVGVGVPQPETVRDTDEHVDGVSDTVDERHSVVLPDSDAIVADAVGVDPAGAQNGPMLYVARCVPSIEASGDTEAMDGDADSDASPVATVCVTESVCVKVAD